MQDKELLNEALDFIVGREQDNDYICDVLNDISEECFEQGIKEIHASEDDDEFTPNGWENV